MIDVSRWWDESFWAEMKPTLDLDEGLIPGSFDRDQALQNGFARCHWGFVSSPRTPLRNLEGLLSSFFRHHQIPPVFLFAYEEVWKLLRSTEIAARTFLSTDDVRMLPAFWAWDVQPGEGGWKPHRDRGRYSLLPSDATGKPLSCTVWVPLTIVDEDTSAIHVLPRWADPVYGTPQENDLVRCGEVCGSRFWEKRLQDIRPLHCKIGDFLIWDQAIMHWGTRASTKPRQSLAIEWQRASVEPFDKPLLAGIPSFTTRLPLIAKQLLQYKHMHSLDTKIEGWALNQVRGNHSNGERT